MISNNLRQEKRIPADQLPDAMKNLTVYLLGEELKADVVDASRSGFGFRLKLDSGNLVRGTRISLKFPGISHKLSAELVFIMQDPEQMCRVGVRLLDSLGYDYYLVLLKDLI